MIVDRFLSTAVEIAPPSDQAVLTNDAMAIL